MDTDKNTLVVHNGTTPGGFPLAQDSSTQANVGAGLIIVTNAYQANVGAARIADVASGQANVGAVQIAKLDKSGGTISGSLIVTGNTTSGNLTTANTIVVGLSGTIGTSLTVGTTLVVTGNTTAGNITPTTDNVSSLGSVSKRWKDLFVGPGSINIDGIVIGNINGQIVISGASDFVFQSTTGAPSVSTASSANIALNAFNQANLAYDSANTAVTTGQANVGAARIADVASGQANTGAGNITVTNAYQANVGAARIADVASGQANVGAVQIAKLDKSGDVMTGTLTTNSEIIGSSITANNTLTINTNAVYESYTSTTSTTSQFALDTFSTSTYRSAKYLVQISSGSAYELIELSLIHDGTNVYLSQYGNIKSGNTLGVFDSTISTGVLSLLATPNNAITTFRAVATLITV